MSRRLTLSLLLLAASSFVSAQTYKVLYNFGAKLGDPTDPHNGVLAQSRGGNIFSSADDLSTDQHGTAFRITPSGTLTVVHRFAPPGGFGPVGGLTLATDGLYYGTNDGGGLHGYGNVFKMKQGGGLTVLHAFDGSGSCSEPWAPPIQSAHGDFYGTARGDGYIHIGCIYRITSSGEFTVLHSFVPYGLDGGLPAAPLVQGLDGYFYGTTVWAGAYNVGVIFRISSTGDYKVLHNFGDGPGYYPAAPLIQANDGNLYSVAQSGGTLGGGVVFKITPQGVYSVLHNFGGGDGSQPIGGLVQATDGNFYGTTQYGGTADAGVLYRVSPAGDFAVLHNFDKTTGAYAMNTPLQHTNGILYGTTAEGGNAGKGTFFSFDLGLPPFVTYLPTYGRPGAVVRILGQGFTDTTQVFFNGTPAISPVVVYPTYLKATVPDGATTGPITVTTSTGTLTSNKVFVVHPN